MGICLFLLVPMAIAEEVAPVSFGGSLGYTYRVLDRPGAETTTGNLLSLDLGGRSYLYRPWISTLDAGLTLTKDGSATGPVEQSNDLITGRINMNVIPKSPFPLEFQYHRTDTRIDTESFTLGNQLFNAQDEFTLDRTYVRQSFIPGLGMRMSYTYDKTEATSLVSGDYSGEINGGQFSWRLGSNNLTANYSEQKTNRSTGEEDENNKVLNVNHQFSPSSSFVVTTLVSDVSIERDSVEQGGGVSRAINEQSQFFSNFYWRPENASLLINGGMRVTDIQDFRNGVSTSNQDAATMSLSGLYQLTQNVNLNAAFSLYNSENQTIERSGTDQRFGAVFRSDVYAWNRFTYNWFADANFVNSMQEDVATNKEAQSQTISSSLGHTLQRRWVLAQDNMLSIHVNQRATERLRHVENEISVLPEEEANFNESIEGLTHSVSLQWTKVQTGATNSMRFSFSDTRDFEATETVHDLLNFQLTRVQTLGRRASLNANIYVQYNRQIIMGVQQDSVLTISGVANYTHNQIFRVPRLRYQSRFNITQPDKDRANRGLETYWDNRLDYSVGKLRSGLVLRVTGRDSDFYNALYFRLARRF